MAALLIFPITAILWMMLNARLGLVVDQPPICDDLEGPQPGKTLREGASMPRAPGVAPGC